MSATAAKRPRGGEAWIDRATKSKPVIVLARRTVSTLYSLGRREKLSECDDQQSLVAYVTPKGNGGVCYEQEFMDEYIFMGTTKALCGNEEK